MTPTYLGFALFLSSATVVCAAPRWPQSSRALALIPLACLFVWLDVWVSTIVAQDRGSYYNWYQEAANRFADPAARDPLFTLLLLGLPYGLSEWQFGVIFSASVFALVTMVFYRLVALGLVSVELVAFGTLALVCDRQFLDLTLNSTRSSIAALVFMIGLLSNRLPLKLLLWCAAVGIHGRLAAILLVAYVFAACMRYTPKLLWVSMTLGVAGMLVHLSGGTLLPEVGALDALLSATESESTGAVLTDGSVARGLTITASLSNSMAAQIVLGILLPAVLATRQRRTCTTELPPEAARMKATLIAFALVTTSIGTLLYPELGLASRLFIVPLMILPLFMHERTLKLLAAVKALLIAVILQQHLA